MAEVDKVGIISCSGEEIPEGTIARLAARRVLELLRPQSTVTLCLPLFLAGEEQERRFAREHPTITVDGCDKLCAKRGTEQYSGQVAASLVVSDILGDRWRSAIARPATPTRPTRRPCGSWPSGSRPKSMRLQHAAEATSNAELQRPLVRVRLRQSAAEGNLRSTARRSRSTACR